MTGNGKKYNFNFRIANINLLIETDLLINGLTYSRYDSFRIEKAISDIKFKYQLVPRLEKENPTKYQYIERNPTSTTIFDFKKHFLHTFYLIKNKNELEKSRLGPYLLAPFLNSFSSAMIHCSAIELNGKVAVFLAPDEGGKTTAINLASEGNALSDDQNVIRKIKNAYHVYATPWGIKPKNISGILGGFFLIEKANKFELTPAHPNKLLSYLWNEHLTYLFFLPKKYSRRHFNFLFELSRSTPVFSLNFPINYMDWDAVKQAMNINNKCKNIFSL